MRKGFTLVEALVVLAISALLAGIALSYNGASRNEIALTVEAAKISQLMLHAESLAIATYGSGAGALVCGYGMVFDATAQTYGIFQYEPNGGVTDCRAAAANLAAPGAGIAPGEIQPYTQGTWDIHAAPQVHIGSPTAPDNLAVVLFLPPTPTTYISRDGSTFTNPTQTSKVYLTAAATGDTRAITVSAAGQVSL